MLMVIKQIPADHSVRGEGPMLIVRRGDTDQLVCYCVARAVLSVEQFYYFCIVSCCQG